MSFYRFDEQGKQIRNRCVLDCTGDEVRVEQAHKDEVDINVIVMQS